MQKKLATVAMAVIAGMISPRMASSAPAAEPAPTEATKADKSEGASVPVRQVVLFSSGVGYFEHFGTVAGNASTELRFKSAQINDILKSLVLQDLDKGKVTAVTYPSQDPVAKTLRSFQVDITSNPSMGELLNQLRGAAVKVSVGGQDLQGTVLGVEQKQHQLDIAGKPGGPAVDSWYLNLITGDQIRQVPLDDVRDIRLADPRLAEELHKALAALAAARDQDKKPVTIRFEGEGNRRVKIGYVVETPVWKTSYRLILSADADRAPAAQRQRGDEAQPPANAVSSRIQGWAIVENQTDNDWNNVELSLVSGRPISFIQDLYQPLYVPRPIVQPELYASLGPQTYAQGIDKVPAEAAKFRRDMDQDRKASAPAALMPMNGAMAGNARGEDGDHAEKQEAARSLDPSASVASVASAAKVGELFQYTVGDVSLPRQTSSMIPIVADDISAEKLSIYNQAVLPRNPLNGAKVKNTTGKHLLAGPVTVFDGGGYAGDAQIDNLPPGQERLISYGIDQQVLVDATRNTSDESILTGKVVKGVLTVSRRHLFTQEYLAENKGPVDKVLVIEHPRRGGGWALLDPNPEQTTDALYRFIGHVGAGKATKLIVREQAVDAEEIAILSAGVDQIEAYIRTGPIPKQVKDALAQAVQLKTQVADTQRQLQERQQQVQRITQEQERIRQNMKTVAPSTDYYNRLLKKLDEQETSMERLQNDSRELEEKLGQQRKSLDKYLADLNVGP
jgi:hypothetical protein